MKQTKVESLVEAIINIASGWIIALLVWMFVISPWMGIDITFLDDLAITGLFTAISIIRSYFWRRFFNAQLHKVVHQFVSNQWHNKIED